jgi:hypothetical protein
LGFGNSRFRTIQVYPKDLRALPGHPEPAVSWHSGFRGGAHARPKTTPVHHAARRRGGFVDARGALKRNWQGTRSAAAGGSKSDNYHEQSYRCYPNDQKGPCGRVALEPMCVHAHGVSTRWFLLTQFVRMGREQVLVFKKTPS